jgi:hypothetical protein
LNAASVFICDGGADVVHYKAPQCLLRGSVAFDDVEHRILAQPEPMANFPVRLAFADKLQHFGRETIRLNALARSPTEDDAALAVSHR